MKRVRIEYALEVIQKTYPKSTDITVKEGFKAGKGWIRFRGLRPLDCLRHLRAEGFEAVQLRLKTRCGTVVYPDFRLWEFEQEFRWEPGDHLKVDVNQGQRPATVLAVVGDEALIEYEMPAGSTAMWVIKADRKPAHKIRNVSYKECPKRFVDAMHEAGLDWEHSPQQH